MSGERFVRTKAIKAAVHGRETAVFDKLGIKWAGGRQHVRCPYPDHDDKNPSWRWDQDRGQAMCTCSKAASIFDVTMKMRGFDFEEAKLFVAEVIGRNDLIEERGSSFVPDKLLNPPPEVREHNLVRQYLAYRLNVEPAHVPKPGTPVSGWSALDYYDPPVNGQGKPVLVGQWPCVVFGTLRSDGHRHAHRIYVEPGGQGKAKLGERDDGGQRDPKKSAPGTDRSRVANSGKPTPLRRRSMRSSNSSSVGSNQASRSLAEPTTVSAVWAAACESRNVSNVTLSSKIQYRNLKHKI